MVKAFYRRSVIIRCYRNIFLCQSFKFIGKSKDKLCVRAYCLTFFRENRLRNIVVFNNRIPVNVFCEEIVTSISCAYNKTDFIIFINLNADVTEADGCNLHCAGTCITHRLLPKCGNGSFTVFFHDI